MGVGCPDAVHIMREAGKRGPPGEISESDGGRFELLTR